MLTAGLSTFVFVHYNSNSDSIIILFLIVGWRQILISIPIHLLTFARTYLTRTETELEPV